MSQPLNKSENGPTATGSDPGLPNRPNNTVTPNPARPYTPVFTADKISESKAKKPREFFDEQNRKSAEQKKQNAQNRKKLVTILVGIAIVFALVITIWLIALKFSQPTTPNGTGLPTVSNNSTEEVSRVRDYLQNIYNDTDSSSETDDNAKIDAVNEAASEILNHDNNSQYADQIKMAQVTFYVNNSYYDDAIQLSSQINADNLLPEQQAAYYNLLSQAYYGIGDKEKADEYYTLSLTISLETNYDDGGWE